MELEESRAKKALDYLAYLLADQMGYEVKKCDVYEAKGSVKSA